MASFDDVDIFGPPAPLPDMGYGLEPMEPTPAMQRRDTVAKYLQKIGYEPRRAYQMAEKMLGAGELVGEFLPGASTKLAEERGDKLGYYLSALDYLGPAGAAAAIPVKVARKGQKFFAKTTAKQMTDKKWTSLSITDESGKKVLGQVRNVPASPGNSYIKVNTNTPEGQQFQQYLIDNQIGRQSKTVDSQFFLDTNSQKAINKEINTAPVKATKKGIASLGDESKDLMFLHNTKEDAIKSFDAMGGIPSPSMAVTKKDLDVHGFGDIQLIGKPNKFDPAVDPRNKIYSADAYTPRAPKKIRLAKEDASERIRKDYDKYIDNMEAEQQIARVQDEFHNLAQKKPFQPENSTDSIERFFDKRVAKRKFFKEQGLNPADYVGAERKKPFPQSKFNKWVAKEKEKYLKQDGVLQYWDEFEETTYTVPYTLDNVVSHMKAETQRGGESSIDTFGPNRLAALMSKELTSLPDVKAIKGRISETTFSGEDVGDQVYGVFKKYAKKDPSFGPRNKHGEILDHDVRYQAEQFKDSVGDSLQYSNDVDSAIKSSYKFRLADFWGKEPPQSLLDDLTEVFVKNAERPRQYFEAKPMRAVDFDEFAGAIVPTKTSKETIDILKSKGLKVVVSDNRIKARDKFKKEMFSLVPIGVGVGIAGGTLDKPLEGNTREIL